MGLWVPGKVLKLNCLNHLDLMNACILRKPPSKFSTLTPQKEVSLFVSMLLTVYVMMLTVYQY